ncbi:MAG TPA: ISNCY family transposase [Telluria sp.]|nr:ISNCY family transposase [Telluria sp.]
MDELERAEIISACAKGALSAVVAAKRLEITTRQVRRLLVRFADEGAAGMKSRRRGRPSNNRLPAGVAQQALQLVREHYADFGPTLACEQLQDRHNVSISKETLRQLMIAAGLWTTKASGRGGLHQPRERRACLGELVQLDGSRHHWFEKRAAPCTLLVYVDDATGRLLHLHFAETECTESYFEATREYISRHGKPRAFYADRAAVFRSPSATSRTRTQFHRALDQLGIELICANTPQAKGRVERLNRTLQDRLVKALRLNQIDSIEAANAWCSAYIDDFNARFARPAIDPIDVHVPSRASEDLALILSFAETRKLSPKLTFQYGGKLFLLPDQPSVRSQVGQQIHIHTYPDGTVELRANDVILAYRTLEPARPARPIEVDQKSLHHIVDKKTRNRHYRDNQPAGVIAKGVLAAKKMSAQKRI